MPKSHKPRKKHTPKKVSYGYNREDIDYTLTLYRRVESAVYFRLPKGEADIDDFRCIRDVFNLVHISAFVRKDFPEDKLEDIQNFLVEAGNANAAIANRGEDTGKFVARGDELRVITDAMAICAPYIEESIKSCPSTFYKEYLLMKKVMNLQQTARIELHTIPVKTIRRMWERL